MTIKVSEILNKSDITLANGRTIQKTQFKTTEDEVMETFAQINAGNEYEGEVLDTPFGKRFKKMQLKPKFAALRSDPDTMLIAYAEHIVSSLIQAGIVKEAKEAAKQIGNFSEVFFKVYDKRKSVSLPEPKKSEEPF